ncbi:unnamed protein product [Clonostachys rhizophaga]|uniref:Uncharacterized protein n=1 Tax=Clonostachys rhizophaga TaxID=160324 RepID=A0A9N9VUA0_9HYPO|nr:unnamed protein product [Clonostachys rhizophaga]
MVSTAWRFPLSADRKRQKSVVLMVSSVGRVALRRGSGEAAGGDRATAAESLRKAVFFLSTSLAR